MGEECLSFRVSAPTRGYNNCLIQKCYVWVKKENKAYKKDCNNFAWATIFSEWKCTRAMLLQFFSSQNNLVWAKMNPCIVVVITPTTKFSVSKNAIVHCCSNFASATNISCEWNCTLHYYSNFPATNILCEWKDRTHYTGTLDKFLSSKKS